MFDKATVVNGADGLMVYYKDGGKEKIEIKPSFEGANDIGGNISSLGGYYNELLYFCDRAAKGAKIEKAMLCDGVASLEFLMKELAFHA